MQPSMSLEDALKVLSAHAAAADAESTWPMASLHALRSAGVLGWCIGDEFGGSGFDQLALLDGYSQLAANCLTTCFILSQRDAACRRLRDGTNDELRRELLPALARGDIFATVGLSQLTTSRQYGRPALVAKAEGDRLVLDGVMPWVTGAAVADFIVTGAALEEGGQVVLVVPRKTAGLTVEKPLELTALQGSLTAEVRCDRVVVERRWLLAGPAERLLIGKGPGGLETSALALGVARAAADSLAREAVHREEWRESATACLDSVQRLSERMMSLARDGGTGEDAADLRAQANALVLRTTQLALAAAKGAGYLRSHPTQRWARQALFFLVWSCPRPALEGTVSYLQPPCAD
jgi:alkylation response protein AidB-like acyl-CoA dehydrogenase